MFAVIPLKTSAEPLTNWKGRPTFGPPAVVMSPSFGRKAMGPIDLKIADLVLDHDNPRITHAEGQQEAIWPDA